MQKIIDETGVAPVINQIELHPLMQQRQLHAWNATHKIQTESWSRCAGRRRVFDQKIIRQLADKYGKTPAQIVIRWHLDSGLVVIPKSVTPSRIAENFNVWDFRLDKDELSEITNWTRTTQGQTGSVRRLTFPPSASGGASLCYPAKTTYIQGLLQSNGCVLMSCIFCQIVEESPCHKVWKMNTTSPFSLFSRIPTVLRS
jgi:hypothetical protein